MPRAAPKIGVWCSTWVKEIEALVQAAPDKQISLTDPDARSMATSGKGTGVVGYNVQTAVDAQHHLIVAHEVTNVGNASCRLPLIPTTISEHYAPIRGGSLGAQQAAMTEANQFCESKGRKFLPENMGVAPGAPIQTNIYGPTNYSVVFQCLLPDDPGLHRPQFEHAPDVVVEQRNRTIP
jgi:hypothetical protein